jgi:hypothetical protein
VLCEASPNLEEGHLQNEAQAKATGVPPAYTDKESEALAWHKRHEERAAEAREADRLRRQQQQQQRGPKVQQASQKKPAAAAQHEAAKTSD